MNQPAQSPATPRTSAQRVAQLQAWGATPLSADADPARGAAAMFTPRQRLMLLAGFALLLMLRLPQAWIHGRFQDEEARIFMAYAWHRPAGVALWRSFAGYLNLGANASTLAMVKLIRAGWLPMELAPYFTMVIGSLFQMLPAVLILTGRGRWLANKWAVIACLAVLAMSPMTEEVFANVLHIQFHLALCCALILVLEIPTSRRVRIAYWLPLLLAPLCGLGAIVLLPLFALRGLLDRDRDRLAQTAMLTVGAMAQMLVFYSQSPVRGQVLDPITLSNVMLVRLVLLPFSASPGALFLGKKIDILYRSSGVGWWLCSALSFAYFGWLLVTALRGGRDAAFWLILAGLTLGVVTLGAGMLICHHSEWFSAGAGERYNFMPLALLGMGLVALVRRGDTPYRPVCVRLCALILIAGLINFSFPIRAMSEGPDWHAEVAHWRQNHDYQLSLWPKQWKADLSDHDRPCPPSGKMTSADTDPAYCESSWLALVIHDSKLTAYPQLHKTSAHPGM